MHVLSDVNVDVLLPYWLAAAVFVFSFYGWDLFVSLAGFLPLPAAPAATKKRRFAVVVCAHNEASVIAGVIRSLRKQQYDAELVHIYVVADHCSDDSARIAEAEGAIVLQRENQEGRTKGYALQWGMQRIIERGPYDALCVFDADNIVAADFLAVMNQELEAGHVAIQAYLDTKNPYDSWVTRAIALAYFVSNRFWLRPRNVLGMSATLGGTGFCLAWDVLTRYGWDPGSLADDLDLTMKLIYDRVPVRYCYRTRTYDEKPDTLFLAFRQRARWLQGHNDVMLRWSWRMLKATLRRPSLSCFDALLHLLQPVRLLAAFGLLLVLIAARLLWPDNANLVQSFHFTTLGWGVAAAIFIVYPCIVLIAERTSLRFVLYLPAFFAFGMIWIPAASLGLLRVRRRIWLHTPHRAPVLPNTESEPEDAQDSSSGTDSQR